MRDRISRQGPSPPGEGAAKRRVRDLSHDASPHPALRATFSRREKDLLATLSADLDRTAAATEVCPCSSVGRLFRALAETAAQELFNGFGSAS